MFTVLLRNLIIIPNIVISSNQMKYVSLGNQNAKSNLLLLIYTLIN